MKRFHFRLLVYFIFLMLLFPGVESIFTTGMAPVAVSQLEDTDVPYHLMSGVPFFIQIVRVMGIVSVVFVESLIRLGDTSIKK